ncbi:hypothetical protein [Roseospirillum parvum]|nr:hypothetical protein [Roseospirillum parvum]
MFGLSLTKILFTVALIAVAWLIFSRSQRDRELSARRRESESLKDRVERVAREAVRRRSGEPPAAPVEDLIECPDCGRFIPHGTRCECGWKG